MSPSDLQNEIMKRIRLLLEGIPLKTESSIPLSDNDTTPFKVFRQSLPESKFEYKEYEEYRDEIEEGHQGDSDKDVYPFVIVNLPGGEKINPTEPQVEPVALLIGVKNEKEDNRGFSDVMEIAQMIMDDFNANPVVASLYMMRYPMSWRPYEEENTFPYFFAQVNLNFEIETATYRGGLDNDEKNW